jgi:amino acid transporter
MTRWQGIGLALGSMFGAGIIFLPSLLVSVAGSDVLVVWTAGMLLSLPLLLIFADLVERVPPGRGIEGFIQLGLGPLFSEAVPVFFLFGVAMGVPGTFLVPGRYLQELAGGAGWVAPVLVLGMIAVSAGTTLLGLRAGSIVQNTVSALAAAVTVAVIAWTLDDAAGGYHRVVPTLERPGALLSGVMISFFAFGGMENMSFIASDFDRPRRDYLVVMSVSLAVYTVLLMLLTANYAAVVSPARVDEVQGLFQLADRIEPRGPVRIGMFVFAFFVCQLNINAWFWGMSRMIAGAGRAGSLPSWFGRGELEHGIAKGVGLQVILSLGGLAVALADPELLAWLFSGISSILVSLYLMAAVSYARFMKPAVKKILGGLTAAGLSACLLAGGWVLPLVAFAVSVLARNRLGGRRAQDAPNQSSS